VDILLIHFRLLTIRPVTSLGHQGGKNFSRGASLSLVTGLLTMQCKRTFSKRFTLSSKKEIAPFSSSSNKKFASLSVIARYIAISYKIDYLLILSRVLFYEEANCHDL